MIEIKLYIHDPYADKADIIKKNLKYYFLEFRKNNYDCILAVGHDFYKKMGLKKLKNISKKKHSVFLI